MNSILSIYYQSFDSYSEFNIYNEIFFKNSSIGLGYSSIATGLYEANTNTLLDFREKYLFQLQELSNERPFVTDKMPQNFLYLGLITAALPEAKIIHVQRDSAAVCWANYKQYFLLPHMFYLM